MAKMFRRPRASSAAAVEETLHRIRRNEDFGSLPMQPAFDPKQRAEAVARTMRDLTPYRLVFEHYGWRWVDPISATRAAAKEIGASAVPLQEGQWRSEKLQLALTPTDVTSNFLSPEDLDRWIREKRELARLEQRRVPKAEVREALRRL